MKGKKIDVLDILPEEAIKKVDELGYKFLSEQGYNTKYAEKSEKERTKIIRKLEREGKELVYSGAVDGATGSILVWFELRKEGKVVARSEGIKFIQRGESDGEG